MSGPAEQAAEQVLAVLELISATDALIASCLTERTERVGLSPWSEIRTTAYCKHCVRAAICGLPIEHARSCIVGQAVAAVAAVAAARPPLPTFSETEIAALRRMDASISEAISEATAEAIEENPARALFSGHSATCVKRRFGCWAHAGVCEWGHCCTCGAEGISVVSDLSSAHSAFETPDLRIEYDTYEADTGEPWASSATVTHEEAALRDRVLSGDAE